MKKKIYFKNPIFIFIIVMSLLSSCEEETTEPEFETNDNTATLVFNPPSTNWYLRRSPDSVTINISNGTPPYVIKERADFSSEVLVKGNQMIIYPKDASEGRIGRDFIVVEDNVGNVNSLNIEVQSLDHSYDSIAKYIVEIVGDTSFVLDAKQFRLSRAQWDEFNGLIFGEVTSEIQVWIGFYANQGAGNYTFDNKNTSFTVQKNSPFNQRFSFWLQQDSIQTANVTLLNRNEVKFQAELNAYDFYNNYSSNHKIKFDVHLVKK